MASRITLCVISSVLAAVTVLAHSQTPPTLHSNGKGTLKFSFARDWNGCGPADEAESGITLTTVWPRCRKETDPTPPPYISVEFSTTESKSAPVTIIWAHARQWASVSRCLTSPFACDHAVSGTIDFGSRPASSPSYDLKFADGSVEAGTFTRLMQCHQVTCW